MEHRKKLSRVHRNMVLVGLVMDGIEAATLILWIRTGIWQPFALGMLAVAAIGVLVSRYYLHSVAYICPACHQVFKPRLRESFFARHTPSTRKLTCACCGHHGFCVEIYGKEETGCSKSIN